MTIKNKAKKIAKQLGVEFTTEYPNNGYAGYSNGSTKLYYSIDSKGVHNINLISTCINCGDSNWLKLNNLLELN